jgi:hypothetical protein
LGWRVEHRVTCDQCSKLGPRGKEPHSYRAEDRAVKAGWIAWEGFYGRFHACNGCMGNLNDDLKLSLADSNEVKGGGP